MSFLCINKGEIQWAYVLIVIVPFMIMKIIIIVDIVMKNYVLLVGKITLIVQNVLEK